MELIAASVGPVRYTGEASPNLSNLSTRFEDGNDPLCDFSSNTQIEKFVEAMASYSVAMEYWMHQRHWKSIYNG